MAVLIKSFESKVEYDNESINLYYTHIKVPDNIFKLFSSKNVKRVVFTLNGGNQNHGAFANMECP